MATRSTSFVTNLVVLRGRVRAEPALRATPDGATLLTFDLVTGADDGVRQTVPVSWLGSRDQMPDVVVGADVAVLGTVQRRFFRIGGRTSAVVDVRVTRLGTTPAARRRVIAAARTALAPS
jgi:hypothetical protein